MAKKPNLWLGVLGAAVLISFAGAFSDDSTSGCLPEYFGDGSCNRQNNNAECGYDSGDCCSCTCVSSGDWECGEDGYACIDPGAPCVDDDDVTVEMVENCGIVQGYGDGYCEAWNNNEGCDFDGGDCCSCTCQPDESGYGCFDGSFACIDPSAPCVDDDDITAEMVEACSEIQGIGNGYCDLGNNNEICGYDGGDCCSCTCMAPPNPYEDDEYYYPCSTEGSGFACIDPSAPCVDDDDIAVDMVEGCGSIFKVGDGYCDNENNNELCGYDGGDCCSCTCVPAETTQDDYYGDDEYRDDDDLYGCNRGFACIDPEALCVNDDDITTGITNACDAARVGDGLCDVDNNRSECNYDGGDCCSCTCESLESQECGDYGFACIDPSAPCVNDDDVTVDIVENCNVGQFGNGYCDQGNNNEECNYDGGDCCSCTCAPYNAADDYDACGRWSGFACIDPMAPCVDDDSVTVEMLEICNAGEIGNGQCDDSNNNEECAWDGGDCCSCTCDPGDFGDDNSYFCRDFACIDPSAECVDDDDITADMLDNCDYVLGIGDGYCQVENNTPECNYDGGDCCECTCDPTSGDDDAACTEFSCIDPSAECVDDDDITVDMLEECGYVPNIGNGYCDQDNNKPECNFDGGDCCECTCQPEVFSDDYSVNTFGCEEFACIDPSASCVNDDPVTAEMVENCSNVFSIGDGYCDPDMNNAVCLYDGGDCCSCTCEAEWDDDYACASLDCKDPGAPCYGDEEPPALPQTDDATDDTTNGYTVDDTGDYTDDTTDGHTVDTTDGYTDDTTDGYTDMSYDFVPWEQHDDAMSYDFVPWEPDSTVLSNGLFPWGRDDDHISDEVAQQQPEVPVPTVDDAVEVGTKTEVGVTATAYDVRPGMSSGENGCGEAGGDGCAPQNTRDGISSEIESRWSCASKLVEGEGPCQIEYTFAEPQEIVGMQVAFWKGNERVRTLKVYLDGVETHTHESYYSGQTFNSINVEATGISRVMLEPVDLRSDEWISLIEVLIFVAS